MSIPDPDPIETAEWLDALEAVLEHRGTERTNFLVGRVVDRARRDGIFVPQSLTTAYCNTIPPEREERSTGDRAIEHRVRSIIRWNALAIILRANKESSELGGHIASFQSAATLYDIGFGHFWHAPSDTHGGDLIYYQGHCSPGIYARAFVEGRLTEQQLLGYRQEAGGKGIPSYPHPWLMPDFWQFPTVSMGLGPLMAIYQARFLKYLNGRGLADTGPRKVWAFMGDGEMDEPESLGAISLAGREALDNLIFVINCNLQRLDGPVRGNGKIIQELESVFRGAGWNVIKVIWGREWDSLLHADRDGALVNLMNVTPDGDYQTYKANDGAFVREHFFGRDPRTKDLVKDLTDADIWNLKRGGHDYRKVYAAYKASLEHHGQPTVILAHTIKGYGLGPAFEGRNATHQMKKLTLDDLKLFRDSQRIPISDEELERDPKLPPYYHPGKDSAEIEYLIGRRKALGGFLPERRPKSAKALVLPGDKVYEGVRKGSGKQEVATTMAFVRLVRELAKDSEIGKRIVPIIPDEARTFGLDSMFPTAKIYNPHGQTYTSVDASLMLAYKESEKGQLLHEGINEAGSTASFTAVGTSYATHGEPMIPIYIFYSMFGFQRTGDGLYAAADQMARGFVVGATAGRTTLTGEGLQHADGHSLLLASTNPAAVAYDAAWSFEIAHIVKDGLRRMYGETGPDGNGENVFYYMTIYNEPYQQPAEPENLDVDGLLKGLYKYADAPAGDGPEAQILVSGVTMPDALKAQKLLAEEWGVRAAVWSATSWTELRREAVEIDHDNLLYPASDPRVPYVTEVLSQVNGPVVAVSDWMRAVPDLIRPWVPTDMLTLGTDGFGFSDTRPAARRKFLIDAESIVVGTLTALARRGEVAQEKVVEAARKYRIDDIAAAGPQTSDSGSA